MDQTIISTTKSAFGNQPVRSISLPPRIHPSSQRIEALLNHLKHHLQHQSSVSTSTTCFDADTIQSDLVVLSELYNCMEELFQSQQTQQALVHYQDGKLVEEALCGSVILLDACGSARDLLLNLREHVQSLQSAIRRRRRGDNSSIETSISAYHSFRKNAKKEISKQIFQLKKLENRVISPYVSVFGQDEKLVFLARVVRESSTITISILCSLLLFMSMPALGITKGSSLISKMRPKRLFSFNKEQKNNTDGVADLNTALCSLLGREKKSEPIGEVVQGALRVLEALDVDIDGLEGGLDSIFRCLVRNRVSFLNMLTH